MGLGGDVEFVRVGLWFQLQIDVLPLREDMQTKCMTPYTVGKVAGEQLCKMYNDLFGVKTITLRY